MEHEDQCQADRSPVQVMFLVEPSEVPQAEQAINECNRRHDPIQRDHERGREMDQGLTERCRVHYWIGGILCVPEGCLGS